MAQNRIILLILIVEMIVANKPRSRLCQLTNGKRGICVNQRNCPHFQQLNATSNDCNGRLVCCPTSTRIVTPLNQLHSTTVPPITRPATTTFAPCTSLLPIIDGTTLKPRPTISSVAISKCAEYKRLIDGRTSITTYVFGGTETKSRQYPHMAALGYGNPSNPDWLCGGSLISHQYVITAAHCLLLSTGSLVIVRLGDLNLRSNLDDARPENFGIAQTIIHPLYRLPQQYNDIALIKLDRYVNFNEYISPICLQTSYVLPNTDFIATGWGRTELTGQPSDKLMQVHLEFFPNHQCKSNFEQISPESLPNGIVDYSQLCAGSYFQEKDTCQGDSGGPLQIKNDGILYMVGITSFGLACGIPNSPAVYTRVSFYIPWIEEIVWGQSS